MSGKLGTDFIITDPTDASSPTLGASWDRNTKSAVKSWATTEHDGEGAHKFVVVPFGDPYPNTAVRGTIAIGETNITGTGSGLMLDLTFSGGGQSGAITISVAGTGYARDDYIFPTGNGKKSYDTTICIMKVTAVTSVGAVTALSLIRAGTGYANGTFTGMSTQYKPQPVFYMYTGVEWFPMNQPPLTGSIPVSPIAAGTITGSQIANLAITGTQIANSTITSDKILNGTILNADIADGTISAAKMAPGVILQPSSHSNLLMYVNGQTSGTALTVSWAPGSVTVASGGSGWSVGDYALITGTGDGNGIVQVTAETLGVATAVVGINGGTGYLTTGTGVACTAILGEVRLNLSDIVVKHTTLGYSGLIGAISNMKVNFGSTFASGVSGGIDVGSPPALGTTEFYYLWVIYNSNTGDVSATLTLTPPPALPILPSGYNYTAFVGAVWYQATGGFQGLIQRGEVAQCDVNTFPAIIYVASGSVFKATSAEPNVPENTAFVHLTTTTGGTLFTYGSNGNYIDGQRVAINKDKEFYCTVNTTHYICGWEYS